MVLVLISLFTHAMRRNKHKEKERVDILLLGMILLALAVGGGDCAWRIGLAHHTSSCPASYALIGLCFCSAFKPALVDLGG